MYATRAAAVPIIFALALLLAACGNSDSKASETQQAPKVALLLPDTRTARYESQDKPLFEAKLRSVCATCELLYANANESEDRQLTQAESVLANGAKVIVLDPVDANAAARIVSRANAENVPVISYDRLVNKADITYYVSFDNVEIGRLQAQTLLDKLNADKKSGQIVMINGSPIDPNAADYKRGAHSVFDGKLTIGREYDTPDWNPDHAKSEMEDALKVLGKDAISGVYAANDSLASGVIAALKDAAFNPLPPVTGQDASLAGVQRVISGEQYMTVHKSVKAEAENAAELAGALAEGRTPKDATAKVNNGLKDVDAIILHAVVVTKENVKDTVVADGLWTVSQICTDQYRSACMSAGLI